jgi:putative flippase GtrA
MVMNELVRIAIFVAVGVWNTVFDFIIFYIILSFFSKHNWPKLSPLNAPAVAHIISFICANSFSYFLNSRFTFSDSTSNQGFGLYFLVSLFSLTVSTGVIQVLNTPRTKSQLQLLAGKILPEKLVRDDKKWAILTKLAGTGFSMVSNYLGYKFIVFK